MSLKKIQKYDSKIPEDSTLYNILDTGRLRKKFKDISKIGEGGFGEVYKAKYHIDQKQYAIKVVRFHIVKDPNVDALQEIYKHSVYKELQAATKISSEYIVRYFNSWFEELNEDQKNAEQDYRETYQNYL